MPEIRNKLVGTALWVKLAVWSPPESRTEGGTKKTKRGR